MRLGLASLLVALLSFVLPSRSTTPSNLQDVEDDANSTSLGWRDFTTSTTGARSSEEEDQDEKPTYNMLDWAKDKENLTVESLKSAPQYKNKQLTIGYLTAVRGELKERQGLAVSGAISMALEEVNFRSSPDLLGVL